MNEGLTGLKQHEKWVINDRILIFGLTIPLISDRWLNWTKKNSNWTLFKLHFDQYGRLL